MYHPGVPLHHDKHFQSAELPIDFDELGSHLSIVISLDLIDATNGCFTFLPGSHHGLLPGFVRDTRPFEQRPLEDHFPPIPSSLLCNIQEIELPPASFCLFHSALLHGSNPSSGEFGRTSMVARLVRNECVIPTNCAVPDEIFFYC